MTDEAHQTSPLTKDELEQPRSAADMFVWVQTAHARFDTKELKAGAREGRFFFEELIHEALPMALFARRYFDASQLVTITHVIGNQNYDGIVEDRREQRADIRYLEVTTTLKTYDSSIRMEILNRDGHVPIYGRLIVAGRRFRRTMLGAQGAARERRDICAEGLKLVEEAVRRKAKKKYEPNTALIVAVDDAGPFREKDDVAALEALAQKTLVPILRGTNFSLLALEGNNDLHLVYPL